MVIRIRKATTHWGTIALGCVVMSTSAVSHAEVPTTWETISTGVNVTTTAGVAQSWSDTIDVVFGGVETSSGERKLIHKWISGTWSQTHSKRGWFNGPLTATSCWNDGRTEILATDAPDVGHSYFYEPQNSWSAWSNTPLGVTSGMSAVSWTGDCDWFGVYYLSGGASTLKFRTYDKVYGWSGERLLTGANGQQIGDVNTNYSPMAIFDGTMIRIFYVRAGDSKIKVRDYPYNGDWNKVSNERCTGQTVSSGGSVAAAWDSSHSVYQSGKQGTAYLVFQRSNGDIGVNFSSTYGQGTWHADSSYTLTTGHNCTGGFRAISYMPGWVDVFCSSAQGIRHGRFRSFG